jgi:Transcriptional regulatory protein, C terminal
MIDDVRFCVSLFIGRGQVPFVGIDNKHGQEVGGFGLASVRADAVMRVRLFVGKFPADEGRAATRARRGPLCYQRLARIDRVSPVALATCPGSRSAEVQFVFADCVLDPDRRELTRGSQAIAIGPQVFDLLVYLVQNRERVVSKDDLLDAVSGGRIVSESTMTSHINAVRKAIGDSGEEQRLLRTVARNVRRPLRHRVVMGGKVIQGFAELPDGGRHHRGKPRACRPNGRSAASDAALAPARFHAAHLQPRGLAPDPPIEDLATFADGLRRAAGVIPILPSLLETEQSNAQSRASTRRGCRRTAGGL